MTTGTPIRTPNTGPSASDPILDGQEEHGTFIHGRLPGDVYLRRPTHLPEPESERPDDGYEVRPDEPPAVALAGMMGRVRRTLIGAPIPSDQEHVERLGMPTGLAVFASDNISSSAYATEEIMRVLVLAGVGALALTLPITVGDRARAGDRRHQLSADHRAPTRAAAGRTSSPATTSARAPALTAAGALLIDYVLTVAVSIAAGVAALTSVFPGCSTTACWSASAFVRAAHARQPARHPRERGDLHRADLRVPGRDLRPARLRPVPLRDGHAAGLHTRRPDWQAAARHAGARAPADPAGVLRPGSVALTGTEAVSNGVPAFKPPEPRNAQTRPDPDGRLLRHHLPGHQLPGRPAGHPARPDRRGDGHQPADPDAGRRWHPIHYLVQLSTALLLVLAANTAFADFPRLPSILARDRFVPRIFQFRGDRLAFTGGIVLLAVLSRRS